MLNSADVTRALWQHFTTQAWSGIAEITAPSATRWAPGQTLDQELQKDRRIDLLFARTPKRPGMGHLERLAVEVKVTRADFLNDIRHPEKQAPWREIAHRHAFAVPGDLVDKVEVPDESGLLVIGTQQSYSGNEILTVKWAKRAPYTDTDPVVPAWMVSTYAYRASWAEGRAKGWTAARENGLDMEELRLEVQRLTAELEQQRTRAERERTAHLSYKRIAALSTVVACATCGEPIVPKRLSGYGGTTWKHKVRTADGPCDAARMEACDAGRRPWGADPVLPAEPDDDALAVTG